MSAGDVVQPIVSEITRPAVKLIAQELDYFLRPRKYLNKMSHQVEPLMNSYEILQKAVDEAKGLGKPIKPEVEQWLESAGEVISRAEDLLRDSNTKRYFLGCCVNFGSRYKINKRAAEISEERIPGLTPAPESTSVALPPPPPIVLSDPDFMAFESTRATMRQIMEALKDRECGVVGILGMGGIGKTSIVKKIAEMVKQDKQFDQVAMAVVSQSPDLKKIQGEIASMLDLKFDQQNNIFGRASQLHQRLINLRSVLVILDDVWARLDLARIGIPAFSEHNGCKVMLTTRNEGVCTSMGMGTEKKIKVGVLSEEESWGLFKSNAGDGIEASPLKEVAADVMKECQCLPLALKTVGSALRGKDIGQWRSAKLDLRKSITTNIEGMSREVISCLRLSYDYLEGNDAKACFLICCLFPEDYEIPIEIIVRYGIGKGLFGDADKMDEVRTQIETMLKKLKASCLLLEGRQNQMVLEGECVKVHDVVRDVGLSITSDEFKILSRSGPRLGRWLRKNSSIKYVKGACFATEEVVSLPRRVQCPELEELILLGSQVDYSNQFFKTMKELKVLIHLGKSQLPTSLKCSVSLRTLYLHQCELGNFSAALGELKKLETLTINETEIESLPVEVGQLTNLRLLDLLGNFYLKSIPSNVISQLRQLEEFYIDNEFDDWEIQGTSSRTDGDAQRGGRASLSELQSLPFLAILSIHVREFAQIPPNFHLQNKLIEFEICVGEIDDLSHHPRSRVLKLGDVEFQVEGVKSVLHLVDGNSNGGGHDSNKYELAAAAAAEDGSGSKYVLTELPGGDRLNGLDILQIRYNSWISSLTSCDDKAVPVLANLKELLLVGLKSLRELGSGAGIGAATGGALPANSRQQLKVMGIHKCHALEGWAVPWSWTYRLHHLEEVSISQCDNITGMFEVKEEENDNTNTSNTLGLLSNLRVISLLNLPRLRCLTNGGSSSSSVIHLSNLRLVYIDRCPSLISVFTRNVVPQSLVHLQILRIHDCSNLEAIFEETTTSIALPDLSYVAVDGCTKLKSLFTVSMAKGLLQLKSLELGNNSQLEEIVSCDTNRASGSIISITWPQIRTINLKGSRQLKRFCPENCCIETPLLQDLNHSGFDSDWMNNFTADPPAHGLKLPPSAMIY